MLSHQRPCRLILAIWGESHLETALSLTLPAVLAPGNLPYLSSLFPCEFVLVTERRLVQSFLSHPMTAQLRRYVKVSCRPMDDLLESPCSYGLTLTLALERGFDDIRETVTETNLLFLNSDFILADGSYVCLAKKLREGARLVASPSYCANAEMVRPVIESLKDESSHVLAVDKRHMAEIILKNLHNTIIGQTIGSPFHFDCVYVYQLYARIAVDTLIGYQMPIALVAMRPTVAHHRIRTFWDFGVASEFCPGEDYQVLGDSDEFLMMELRERDVGKEYIRTGSLDAAHISAKLSSQLTYDQYRCAENLLILHSRDLFVDLGDGQFMLNRMRDEIRNGLSGQKVVKHQYHPIWMHHLALLHARQKERSLGGRLRSFFRL